MTQLRRDYSKFQELNAEILVFGPENSKNFRRYWDGHNMPFPGCPDPSHRIADLYGQEVRLLNLGRMPSLIIIDSQGIVRYIHRGKSMADIPSNTSLFKILSAIVNSENERI